MQVVVEDTGIGIPENLVDHVFGEFNQVESERNRQFDGTGLGLAIAKELVGLMGGHIWVTSEEGCGSRFGFDLELEATDGAETALPDLHDNFRHVVVAGDFGLQNRDPLCHQLEELGLKVTCPKNANALVSEFDQSVDLVILDYSQSEPNAWDLAQSLRVAGHAQPIFLLSHNPGISRAGNGSASVDLVGQRPFTRKELFAWLSTVKKADTNKDHEPIAPDNSKHHVAQTTTKSTSDWFDENGTKVVEQEQRRMRILAAEDNNTNRLVFSKMLKSLDIDLKFARDGEEAVALFESFAPDLIFMDISMPRMDGKEATRQIRKLECAGKRHTPIVATTAHAMKGDDTEVWKAGLDRYLTKPLKKAELVAQITEFCPEHALPPVPIPPDQAVG